MRTNNFIKKAASMVAILFTGIGISCEENVVPLSQEASYVVEESITDVYYEDADDIANTAIANDSRTAGGRISAEAGLLVNDDRLCPNVVVTFTLDAESTLEYPIGDIVIDFGDGCTDPRGNVRTGKIKVHFEGRRFIAESFVTVTFDGYTINEIELNGTRTLTNITGSSESTPKFRVELDGTINWPDGTSSTRTHCYVRTWNRGNVDNLADDQLIITQCENATFAAEGTNRRGIEYKMTIEKQLVFKRGCPIAVSGVKKFLEVATGKEIIIDYGDGECDRTITITVDGSVRTVQATRK